MPPRGSVVSSPADPNKQTPRDRPVRLRAKRGRRGWQRATGYGRRNVVETAIGRSKHLIGPKLRAHLGWPARKGHPRRPGAQPHDPHRQTRLRPPLIRMLGHANHLGLFSEEIGPSGEPLGNTLQAFTHLPLITAAFYLDRELSGGKGSGTWRP